MEPAAYIVMGNSTGLTTAPFRCEEGVHQGAIDTEWFVSIRCNRASKWLKNNLREHDGCVIAIVDNNYLMGPPEAIFLANKIFARDLKEVGLKLQPAKLKCYIDSAHMDARWDVLLEESQMGR